MTDFLVGYALILMGPPVLLLTALHVAGWIARRLGSD